MEILRTKIDNEINKRQLVIQLFGLLVGGIIGLLFVPFSLKKPILIILGFYYCYVLLDNYIILNNRVNNLIKEMERRKL